VLEPAEDAFGRLLTDLLAGRRVAEVVERDDGCVFTAEAGYYVAPFRRWWPYLLQKLARAASERGRILAGSYDPYDGASELARRYHARNRARGKMVGVERLRVRYRQYATPWYDVLSPHATKSCAS
jgi:hypothetical protein